MLFPLLYHWAMSVLLLEGCLVIDSSWSRCQWGDANMCWCCIWWQGRLCRLLFCVFVKRLSTLYKTQKYRRYLDYIQLVLYITCIIPIINVNGHIHHHQIQYQHIHIHNISSSTYQCIIAEYCGRLSGQGDMQLLYSVQSFDNAVVWMDLEWLLIEMIFTIG